MRIAAVVVVVSSSVASASPDSVAAADKVVRANIAASWTSHAKLDATTTHDLVFDPAVDENRTPWFDSKCGDTYCNDEVMLFGDWVVLSKTKLAPFKPTIVLDDDAHVGWFSADLVFKGALGTGDTVTVQGSWPVRVTGVLVDDHGWKVAAEKFSLVATDASLVKTADWTPNYGDIKDKPELEFAAWFPGHLAEHMSSRATNATGTSPTDFFRTKPLMTTFVRTLDKLKMTTKWIELTPLAGGKIAWAHTTVTLQIKGGEKIMTVGIVAVPEGGTWKWVSLNWSPEVQPDAAVH